MLIKHSKLSSNSRENLIEPKIYVDVKGTQINVSVHYLMAHLGKNIDECLMMSPDTLHFIILY